MLQNNDIEFTCIDIRGIFVSCSKERWRHLTEHKEMIDQQVLVKSIIESPEFINISASFKDRQTYYKKMVLPSIGSSYVRTVVKIHVNLSGKKKGYVINAFSCKGEQKGEVRIWTRS
jgi:hypothetical protein